MKRELPRRLLLLQLSLPIHDNDYGGVEFFSLFVLVFSIMSSKCLEVEIKFHLRV